MLARAGYDNRTPAGAGNIQLVSPALTRWKNLYSDYYTGSIATLKLRLVPEPEGRLMLVAGIGALALLCSVNGQRGRAWRPMPADELFDRYFADSSSSTRERGKRRSSAQASASRSRGRTG